MCHMINSIDCIIDYVRFSYLWFYCISSVVILINRKWGFTGGDVTIMNNDNLPPSLVVR